MVTGQRFQITMVTGQRFLNHRGNLSNTVSLVAHTVAAAGLVGDGADGGLLSEAAVQSSSTGGADGARAVTTRHDAGQEHSRSLLTYRELLHCIVGYLASLTAP